MVIKVKLNVSGKIGYIHRTFSEKEELEYYLQFRFEDINNFVGGYYKSEAFEILGRSTIEECKK